MTPRAYVSEHRYGVTLGAAWVAWIITGTVVVLRVAEIAPHATSSIAVLSVGVAIAASLSLGRQRLASTIAGVFQAGLATSVTLTSNAVTDTCLVSIDADGYVQSVDHADAIGWDGNELLGKCLRDLLSPRAGGSRLLVAGTNTNCPMRSQAGVMFDARISVAMLGTTVIATIAPSFVKAAPPAL